MNVNLKNNKAVNNIALQIQFEKKTPSLPLLTGKWENLSMYIKYCQNLFERNSDDLLPSLPR